MRGKMSASVQRLIYMFGSFTFYASCRIQQLVLHDAETVVVTELCLV